MNEETGSIYSAILAAMNKVGYVSKDGKNNFHGYRFASEAAFIDAIRPVMLENGIIVHVIDWAPQSMSYDSKNEKGYDKTSFRVSGVATIRFYHVPSSTFIDVKALGEGTDSGDEASYKAATGALKYALRQTYLIETGDDPDKSDEKPKTTPDVTMPNPAMVPRSQPVTAPLVMASDGLMVHSVKKFEGTSKRTGKPYTKYEIEFSDGKKASTFDRNFADEAQNAIDNGALVKASLRPNANPRFAADLESLEVLF